MSWQPIIAGVIVLAAAIWLARKIYRTLAAAGGGKGYVSSCGSCSKNQQNVSAGPLIQLDAKPTASLQSDSDGSTKSLP